MNLLWWAIGALVISLVAGALGFTGIAQGAAVISRVLFGVFLFIFLVLLVLFLLGVGAVATV